MADGVEADGFEASDGFEAPDGFEAWRDSKAMESELLVGSK